MEKIKKAIFKKRRAKEYDFITRYLKLTGILPSNGLMARVFNHQYTPQNYSLILKKFNELFLKK